MLHVVDNWLSETLVRSLRDLCVTHGALKQTLDSDALFSWRPDSGRARSSHAPKQQALMDTYLNQHLRPLVSPWCPQDTGAEWWCNTNNNLDWHIDKDEVGYRENGRYSLPLLSTVFYPHVSCAGGELLVADNPPVTQEQTGPPPHFRSVISVPPVLNRLVIFPPGILHRINPLEGERYSLAVNLWSHEPLTTQESAPPA